MADLPVDLEGLGALAVKVITAVRKFARDQGVPEFIGQIVAINAAGIVLIVPVLIVIIVQGLLGVGTLFASTILRTIGKARAEGASDFNEVIAASMSELLGVEVSSDDLPNGKGANGHTERARAIGGKLHELLLAEFGGLREINPQDGSDNARAFSGFALNFAISNAFISILTEAESIGFLKNFRELGESAADALGLGRLQRLALQPLIRNMIQQPYDLFLKSKLRPDRLSDVQYVKAMRRGTVEESYVRARLAEKGFPDLEIEQILLEGGAELSDVALVRALQRGTLTEDAVRATLFAKGYSITAIDQVILDGTQRLSDTDLLKLVRYGDIPVDIALAELIQQGMTREKAEQTLRALTLTRTDSLVNSYVNKIESQYLNGFIDEETFMRLLDKVPWTDEEKQWERNFVGVTLDAPQTTLTFAQVKTGIIGGVLDFNYMDQWLINQGYSDQDQLYLEFEILQALDKTASKDDIATAKRARQTARAGVKRVPLTITRQ